MRVPGELIPITLFICIAATMIGVPIARAWARRLESPPREPNQLPDVTARLDAAALDACFDLDHHLRHAPAILDRALGVAPK